MAARIPILMGLGGVSKSGNKYTLTNVTEDLSISAASEPQQMEVKFSASNYEGFSIRTNNYNEEAHTATVAYGTMLQFQIVPNAGYNRPNVSYKMGVGQDTSLTSTDGTYTINNVTDNVTVTITPEGKTQYTVSWNEPEGATVEVTKTDAPDPKVQNGSPVDHGTKLTIKVTVADAYSKSASRLSVLANNSTSLPKQGSDKTYTFTYTVESAVNFSISDLTLNTYSVARPVSGTGYTVSYIDNVNSVQHGGSYHFTINVNNGYKIKDSSSFKVKPNNNESFKENISYNPENLDNMTKTIEVTISDIQEAISYYTVEGIEEEKYTATVDSTGNNTFELSFKGHDASTELTNLTYNSSVTFTVKAKSGYKVTGVDYSIGGSGSRRLTGAGAAQNEYTVEGITSNITIYVHTQALKITVHYLTPSTVSPTGFVTYEANKSTGYDNGESISDVAGKLTLTLPGKDKVTRQGFKFVKWKRGGSDCKTIEFGTDDISVELTAEWSLDPDALEHVFDLQLDAELREDNGWDVVYFTATLSVTDETSAQEVNNLQYKIIDYGLIYGKSSTTLDNLLSGGGADKVKSELKDLSIAQQGQTSISSLTEYTDDYGATAFVYAYTVAGGDQNAEGIRAENTFVVKFGTKGQIQSRSAIAWVRVKIGGDVKVVLSELKPYKRAGAVG